MRIEPTTVALQSHHCALALRRPQFIKLWHYIEYLICRIIDIAIRYNSTNQLHSFTLYPAHSRVGSGNIVIRHSAPHFPSNFSRHYALSGGTQRRTFALVPDRRNENIKKSSFISSRRDRTHNRRVSVTPPCHWATTALRIPRILFNIKRVFEQ